MRMFALIVSSLIVLGGCTNPQKLCIQGTTLSCLCASGQPGVALCLDGETASSCNCPQLTDLPATPSDLSPPPDLATPADLASFPDALDPNRRYVFVTAATYQGDFGSGDSICAAAAGAAGLPSGTWCAWVDDISRSGASTSAADCLDDSNKDRVWFQANAPGRPGLKVGTPASLVGPINRDQYGDPVAGTPNIWFGQDCKSAMEPSWTTKDSTKTGSYVTITTTRLSYIPGQTQPCDSSAHILCVQK